MLYHLVTPADWAARPAAADYLPDGFANEGFIHLSTAAQWPGVWARYYAHEPHMVLLHIDESQLGEALRYEPATGGELFPHLYAPLPRRAIVQAETRQR